MRLGRRLLFSPPLPTFSPPSPHLVQPTVTTGSGSNTPTRKRLLSHVHCSHSHFHPASAHHQNSGNGSVGCGEAIQQLRDTQDKVLGDPSHPRLSRRVFVKAGATDLPSDAAASLLLQVFTDSPTLTHIHTTSYQATLLSLIPINIESIVTETQKSDLM